jgi:hypothetical protein
VNVARRITTTCRYDQFSVVAILFNIHITAKGEARLWLYTTCTSMVHLCHDATGTSLICMVLADNRSLQELKMHVSAVVPPTVQAMTSLLRTTNSLQSLEMNLFSIERMGDAAHVFLERLEQQRACIPDRSVPMCEPVSRRCVLRPVQFFRRTGADGQRNENGGIRLRSEPTCFSNASHHRPGRLGTLSQPLSCCATSAPYRAQ